MSNDSKQPTSQPKQGEPQDWQRARNLAEVILGRCESKGNCSHIDCNDAKAILRLAARPQEPTSSNRSASQPPEAQDARTIVENLQSALVIDGGRATAGVPWSVLLGNLLQWIETGQQKASQRGQQAMAEKAGQLREAAEKALNYLDDGNYGEDCELADIIDGLRRSLAGADK
jgi:hypothetical protein